MRLSSSRIAALTHRPQQDFVLWDKAGTRPSLDLQFADRKDLVDAITGSNLVDFTRASSGTYVGSDGLIKTATTNLVLQSEDFSTTWSVTRSSVSINTEVSPDGQTTADTLIEDNSSSSTHFIGQGHSVTSGKSYTFSVYVKRASGSRNINLRWSAGFNTGNATFNFDTGSISGSSAIENSSAISLLDNWWRISITQTATSSASVGIQLFLVDSGISYTGDGTSGIYLWGAQLEQSSTVGEYIPTTSTINSAPRFDHDPTTGESLGLLVEESRTNLLLWSEEFQQSDWFKGRINVSTNSISAPDGTLTADKLVATTDTNISHLMDSPLISTAAGDHTFSAYFKAGEYDYVVVDLRDSVGIQASAVLDLQDGSTSNETGTVSVVPFPDGWYRLVLSATLGATSSFRTVRIFVSDDGTTGGYTGDDVSGIYLWGAQLEEGSFPTSYIPTEGSTVTRAADVASITGSNFSSWYRQDEGAVFAEFKTANATGLPTGFNTRIFQISDGTTANRYDLFVASGGNVSTFMNTSSVSQLAGVNVAGVVANNSVVSACFGYKENNVIVSADGTLSSADTSCSIPATSQLNIGSRGDSGSGTLDGTIRRLTYWPTRLGDDTLQTITQ